MNGNSLDPQLLTDWMQGKEACTNEARQYGVLHNRNDDGPGSRASRTTTTKTPKGVTFRCERLAFSLTR